MILISFKGLNYGIDFKGGTLIELRVESDKITISEIMSANDCTEYTLRDNDKFNKIIYSYEQSATIGKRVTSWFKYKPVVESGVTTTYARTQISQSFSTDLNENYSQTELIIEG